MKPLQTEEAQPMQGADLVLKDARVYPSPGHGARPISVAIAGGRIAYAGSSAGLAAWMAPRTRCLDMAGHTLLAGFVDAHAHPLIGGMQLLECDLSGLETLSEYQQRIRHYAESHPDAPFIRGSGWRFGAFPNETPDRAQLDAAVNHRPVFLRAMDGHSLWANSAALNRAGIHAESPQPPGGHIEKEARTGTPTGWLKEWSAMNLLEVHFPAATHENRVRGVRAYLKKAARVGITATSDAMMSRADYQAYAELDALGELTVRIHGMALHRPEDGPAGREEILHLLAAPHTGFLQVRAVKLFLDGVVEAHTAWLRDSYVDQPHNRGSLIWPPEDFMHEVEWWDARGVSLHIHAIGDAAVELAVDALEQAAAHNGRRDNRHQIAHADMVRPAELARMARLGILAVVQPAWCHVDRSFIDSMLPALGRERAERMYPFASMFDAGVAVACGSDWPFGGDDAAFSPLEGIQTGVTRLGVQGGYASVPSPAECVSLPHWLDAYTRQGAFAQFRENEIGCIREGMRADLVVVEGPLLERSTSELASSRILLTLSEGRPVHTEIDDVVG